MTPVVVTPDVRNGTCDAQNTVDGGPGSCDCDEASNQATSLLIDEDIQSGDSRYRLGNCFRIGILDSKKILLNFTICHSTFLSEKDEIVQISR